MEQITIGKITYNVIQARNADDMEAAGFPNVARTMREYGHRLDLHLQRPNGKNLYWAIQYKQGHYCSPVKV